MEVMVVRIFALMVILLFPLLACISQNQDIKPVEITLDEDDIEITKDVVIKKGEYTVKDENKNGVLIVKADNVTIDFNGAVLQGTSDPNITPNKYTGTGIVVEGRKGVVIKNAVIRRMLIGIQVYKSSSVTIHNCNVSNNFAQRLKKKDDGACTGDHWLTEGFDPDCWKTLGAGILLRDSEKCVVSSCVGHFGQNGIMLIKANECQIYDNDMSFNSGWGLRLFGACRNQITHSKFDYCVRCHGTDLSGDSAGILVQRGSSHNIFAYNSATHGGDGFFLGSATESLKDGSNDNLVMYNDFSYSPCNAIEATFSKGNKFIKNKCNYSGYGVWAGLSYESWFIENEIIGCGNDGIAIENGHDNLFEGNTIEYCGNGIRLWNSPNWVSRESTAKSYRYHILRNNISYSKNVGIDLNDTPETEIFNNSLKGNFVSIKLQKCPETKINNNNFLLHSKVGGNLALGKKATASVLKEKAERTVDGKTDESNETAWGPVTLKYGDWWQADMGEEKEFNAVVIYPGLSSKFHIDMSSTDKFAGEEQTIVTENQKIGKMQNNINAYLYNGDTDNIQLKRIKALRYSIYTFPPVKARYIRFIHDGSKREGIRIHEFEVYNVPDIEKEYFRCQGVIKSELQVRPEDSLSEGKDKIDASKNYWGTTEEKEISRFVFKSEKVDCSEPAKESFKIDAIENKAELPPLKGSLDISLPQDYPKGVKYIKINQWGPVVPVKTVRESRQESATLSQKQICYRLTKDGKGPLEIGIIKVRGKEGTEFKIEDVPEELNIEKNRDAIPANLVVKLTDTKEIPPRSITEKSFRIVFPTLKKEEIVQVLLIRMSFEAALFKWDQQKTPIDKEEAWERLFSKGEPEWKGKVDRINFKWGGNAPDFAANLPADMFAMRFTTTLETPEEEFYFHTLSDDGARVRLDDKDVIDNWTVHGDTQDNEKVKLTNGKHALTIELFECSGLATICFWIDKEKDSDPPEDED